MNKDRVKSYNCIVGYNKDGSPVRQEFLFTKDDAVSIGDVYAFDKDGMRTSTAYLLVGRWNKLGKNNSLHHSYRIESN